MGNCHTQKDPVIPAEEFDILGEVGNCTFNKISRKLDMATMIELMHAIDDHINECPNESCNIKRDVNRHIILGIIYLDDNKKQKQHNIPVGLYHRMNIKNKVETCAICMENFDKRDIICNTDCNHQYHYKCMIEAMEYSHKCAYCRKPIV